MKNHLYWQCVWFTYFFAAMMIHHGWSLGHTIVACAYLCAWLASKCIVEDAPSVPSVTPPEN